MRILTKNLSGNLILKGQLVCQTGFISPEQIPTIAVASASNFNTSGVLGIASFNLPNNKIGLITTGDFFSPIDTSNFISGGFIYLSDTPGNISNIPGTNPLIVGYAVVININGTIFLNRWVLNVK